MKRILLLLPLAISTCCAASDSLNATAVLLDDYLEIAIHHPSNDPQKHYVSHVTVKKGISTIFKQSFTSQTDPHSQDIQIPHPQSPRKRFKRGDLITVQAECNEGATLEKEIAVR